MEPNRMLFDIFEKKLKTYELIPKFHNKNKTFCLLKIIYIYIYILVFEAFGLNFGNTSKYSN